MAGFETQKAEDTALAVSCSYEATGNGNLSEIAVSYLHNERHASRKASVNANQGNALSKAISSMRMAKLTVVIYIGSSCKAGAHRNREKKTNLNGKDTNARWRGADA